MPRILISALALIVSVLPPFQIARAQQNSATFGDWLVGLQDGNQGVFAATVNDSGLAMGEYCFSASKKCVWLVTSELSCDENARYPALANTDAGAFSLELVCGSKQAGRSVYIFSDWSKLEDAIKRSKLIGIAVPMPGDQFEVWRFSLNGMVDATAAMEKTFFGDGTAGGATGTSTQRL